MTTDKCQECRENVPLVIQSSGGRSFFVFATHYKMEGRCSGSGSTSIRKVESSKSH